MNNKTISLEEKAAKEAAKKRIVVFVKMFQLSFQHEFINYFWFGVTDTELIEQSTKFSNSVLYVMV